MHETRYSIQTLTGNVIIESINSLETVKEIMDTWKSGNPYDGIDPPEGINDMPSKIICHAKTVKV